MQGIEISTEDSAEPAASRTGRTLLSAGFDFDLPRTNTKIKGGGPECPPHALIGSVPCALGLAQGEREMLREGLRL
jgi:hypothetical protein